MTKQQPPKTPISKPASGNSRNSGTATPTYTPPKMPSVKPAKPGK